MFFFSCRYQLLEFNVRNPPAPSVSELSDLENWVEIGYESESDNPDESRVESRMTILDIDQSGLSDRPEWGHLRYQARYNPAR